MSPLEELFESNAVVKILDFLTLYKDFEYTRTEIARETGISRRTLYQVFPTLEKFDLVTVSKAVGNSKLYKLNTENSICEVLVALGDEIAFFKAEKATGMSLTRKEECQTGNFSEAVIKIITVKGNTADVKRMVEGIGANMNTSFPITDITKNAPESMEVQIMNEKGRSLPK
ncbi:MAG: winged helix-turn-helix domain-containing protein [Candidatus Bathyarchaeia archaeon]